MFSENNRISGRQMYRLMTYDLLGIGTLLVPQMLAKTAGRDGILSIGIGMAAALAYLWILRRLAPPAQESYPEYMERQLGRIGGGIVQTGYLIYLVLLAGYVAYLFADIILRDLLRGESFYLVLSVIMLLVLYGLAGGIEGRARVYEMLFWFLLIPLFLMLFAAADEVCTDYWGAAWNEQLKGCGRRSLRGVFESFLCIFPSFFGNICQAAGNIVCSGKEGNPICGMSPCGALSGSGGNFRGTGACGDGLSGSHADEHGKNIRRLFEKNRRVYVRRVVLYAVCTFKQLRLLRKQHSREIMETYSQNAKREKLHVDFLWICGGGSFCGSDLFLPEPGGL